MQNRFFNEVEAAVAVAVEATVLGIDDDDVADAHEAIVFQFDEQALDPVLGGEDFEHGKRGRREYGFGRLIPIQDRDIRDAVAGRTDLQAQFRSGTDVPLAGVLLESGQNSGLPG